MSYSRSNLKHSSPLTRKTHTNRYSDQDSLEESQYTYEDDGYEEDAQNDRFAKDDRGVEKNGRMGYQDDGGDSEGSYEGQQEGDSAGVDESMVPGTTQRFMMQKISIEGEIDAVVCKNEYHSKSYNVELIGDSTIRLNGRFENFSLDGLEIVNSSAIMSVSLLENWMIFLDADAVVFELSVANDSKYRTEMPIREYGTRKLVKIRRSDVQDGIQTFAGSDTVFVLLNSRKEFQYWGRDCLYSGISYIFDPKLVDLSKILRKDDYIVEIGGARNFCIVLTESGFVYGIGKGLFWLNHFHDGEWCRIHQDVNKIAISEKFILLQGNDGNLSILGHLNDQQYSTVTPLEIKTFDITSSPQMIAAIELSGAIHCFGDHLWKYNESSQVYHTLESDIETSGMLHRFECTQSSVYLTIEDKGSDLFSDSRVGNDSKFDQIAALEQKENELSNQVLFLNKESQSKEILLEEQSKRLKEKSQMISQLHQDLLEKQQMIEELQKLNQERNRKEIHSDEDKNSSKSSIDEPVLEKIMSKYSISDSETSPSNPNLFDPQKLTYKPTLPSSSERETTVANDNSPVTVQLSDTDEDDAPTNSHSPINTIHENKNTGAADLVEATPKPDTDPIDLINVSLESLK